MDSRIRERQICKSADGSEVSSSDKLKFSKLVLKAKFRIVYVSADVSRATGTPTLLNNEAWVTESSGKAPYREMRGFAFREKQPQSGALGTANRQPASCVSLSQYAAFPGVQICMLIWLCEEPRRPPRQPSGRSGTLPSPSSVFYSGEGGTLG